ncbi:phage tail protein [Nocardia aurantia]|uniref:Phage tail collar domain-containing protein n=1 Tax=Nocardia aurantia TaxID=2585199 RepID=A0A7K0E1B8_9NOCA|nr:tail fiber protein [Nocardia aurantia]MQY30934.1 hypothetical protein [Nocardia aurantia]
MEPFLGQISVFPYSFAPQGWAWCEGQVLPVAQNQALFSLLGSQFGGDGTKTFVLPNLKKQDDALGEGLRYAIAMEGTFPNRD